MKTRSLIETPLFVLVMSVVVPLLVGLPFAFIGAALAAENPAVMQKAEATVRDLDDGLSEVPFDVLRKGLHSFYGIDALVTRDSSLRDSQKPSIFLAANDMEFDFLWKKYIDRDAASETIPRLKDNGRAFFIFQGLRYNSGCGVDAISMTLKRIPDAPRMLSVCVEFKNPTEPDYKNLSYKSPYAILVFDDSHIEGVGLEAINFLIKDITVSHLKPKSVPPIK